MDVSQFIIGIILAFARISSFLFYVPYLNGKHIPNVAKITISLSLAIVGVNKMEVVKVQSLPQFIILLIMQIAFGLTLAFAIDMIFSAAKNAGAMADMDMGLSSASLIDPSNGQRTTMFSDLYYSFFMVIFVSLKGLDTLIYGIIYSFKVTNITFFLGNENFFQMLVAIFSYMLTATIQMALPLSASIFIANIVLLILGKTAPQLNIFMNMYSIKIAIGFVFLIIMAPYLGEVFLQMNNSLTDKYFHMINMLIKIK